MARPRRHSDPVEKLLIRRLLGELSVDDAADLRRLESTDPSLAERARRLEAVWSGLVAPPDLEPPPTLASDIVAAARRSHPGAFGGWVGVTRWARLSAAATILVGILIGMFLGPGVDLGRLAQLKEGGTTGSHGVGEIQSDGVDGDNVVDEDGLGNALLPEAAPSFSDAYWLALGETGGRLGRLDAGDMNP